MIWVEKMLEQLPNFYRWLFVMTVGWRAARLAAERADFGVSVRCIEGQGIEFILSNL